MPQIGQVVEHSTWKGRQAAVRQVQFIEYRLESPPCVRVQAILKREGLTDLAKEVAAMAFAIRKSVGRRLEVILESKDC